MSTKIINNLKVHGENTTQKYTDAQYNTDTQRINGAQPGTPISSKLINTGLRNATLVTSALIEALKTVVPNDNDLTTPITVGTATTHEALVAALTEALVKIRVEHAILADNVKSGAIVEETTTARESKQGYGISLGLNSKLQFKTSWVGTHKNNDVLYYSAAGALKGFYIVKGLSAETKTQPAGTLTINSGDTPITHAANLQRLTFETAISTDTNLSKTDTISSISTTNQLATAKGVYDYAQAKLEKYTTSGIKILTRSITDGRYYDLDKVTTMPATPTDSQIPTAKLLKDYAQSKIVGNAGDILIKSNANDGAVGTISKTTEVNSSSTDLQIPTAKAVYTAANTLAMQNITKVLWSGNKTVAENATEDIDILPLGTIDEYSLIGIEILCNGRHHIVFMPTIQNSTNSVSLDMQIATASSVNVSTITVTLYGDAFNNYIQGIRFKEPTTTVISNDSVSHTNINMTITKIFGIPMND
jgi:hypothetical protein